MNILKRNIIACYVSDAVLGTYFQLAIWIVYQSKFLDFSQIVFFSGLALIVEVIMQIPTGAFADIVGRRISLALGNLFMALPMFLIAFYPTYRIMWIYSIMWGLGNALCMGTSKAILYDTLVDNNQQNLFSKILGKSTLIFQFSAAISIASGGYLYQIFPQLPYLVSGITSIFGIFVSFLFIEPLINNKFKLTEFLNKNYRGFLEIFKNMYVTKLSILFILAYGIASVCQKFFTQPYMLELNMNDIQRSWITMFVKLFIAILGAKLITISRFNKSKFSVMVIPVVIILTLLPAKYLSLPYAYMVLIGIAFSSGNSGLFMSPEINENISSDVRSTALSSQRMLSTLVGTVIQWISVPIILRSSIGTFFSYLGIFCLVVILPLSYSIMLYKHNHTNIVLDTIPENLAK